MYKELEGLTKREIINYINKEDELNRDVENETDKEVLAEINEEENDLDYTKNDDKMLIYLEDIDPNDGLI